MSERTTNKVYLNPVRVLRRRREFKKYCSGIFSSEEYENCLENRRVLDDVLHLHPEFDSKKRKVSATRISERLKENPEDKKLIQPWVQALFNQQQSQEQKRFLIETVGEFGLAGELPRLEEEYRLTTDPKLKESIIKAVSNFSWENNEVRRIIDKGLADEDWGVIEQTLMSMTGMELPREVVETVWDGFLDEEKLPENDILGEFLAAKDPERLAGRIIKEFESTLRTDKKDKMDASWRGWALERENGQDKHLEDRVNGTNRAVILKHMAACIENLEEPEDAVGSLNFWLSMGLGEIEDYAILLTLYDHPNIDTVYTIARRQEKSPLSKDNFELAARIIRNQDEKLLQKKDVERVVEVLREKGSYKESAR